jgi:capsular exopolysaccharide synthesis family protein
MINSKDGQSVFSINDLKFVLRIAQKNWWIPLVFVVFFYLAALFYSYKLTPIYKVSSEILIQNNESYYKSSVISEENFLAATYLDNSNQQRVLQSYDLIKSVVEKLIDRLKVSYYIVGKVRTTEQFSGMPFDIKVNFIDPSFYELTFDLKIINNDEYEIKYELNKSKISYKGKFNTPLSSEFFNFIIIKNFSSKGNLDNLQDIFYQFKIHSIETIVQTIRSSLKVENPEYTNFLVLSMEDILPERSKLIQDSLISTYMFSRIKQRYDLNENTVNYIDKQLDEISHQLRRSMDTLLRYKDSKSIVNLSWEENTYLARITDLDKEISNINIQIKALQDLENYVKENKDPQFLPPSSFLFEEGGYLDRAISELYTKQLELNKILQVAKYPNPTLIETQNYINNIKKEILIYINNSKNAILQKKENLYQEFSKYLSEAKNIEPKNQELNNITRILRINENIYTFLLEKRANTLIARASIVPDVKVVEKPRNLGIVWPDKNSINKKFIIAGLTLSLLIIIIRSIWYTRIESIEQLKELTEIPTLGILPKFKKDENQNEFFIHHSPNSTISESLRSIRANLQYAIIDNNFKTILFTSYMPSEGKTFVSLNMAALLAKTGKKTILIDLDLHKPRISSALKILNNEKGVTTYINNIHSMEEIIYSHPDIQNLHIIFSGPIPPNPSDYTLSEKLKTLIREVKEKYDYVIIDTPPAGILSDSLYLMQFADCITFVVRSDKSSTREIQFINSLQKENNLLNIFIILNRVKSGLRKYYYSGYGYSYGYKYGYGYGYGRSKNV